MCIVKDKHSLHDLMRMFVLYGEVVRCVCDPRGWTEKGLQDSPVLPEWLNFRCTAKFTTRRAHPLPFGSQTTRRPAGAAGGAEASIVARATILCRAYHYAQRMRTVYNFHAYTLRFRCLPRPWRARAWRARRLKKGGHWRRRRTLISYLKDTCK